MICAGGHGAASIGVGGPLGDCVGARESAGGRGSACMTGPGRGRRPATARLLICAHQPRSDPLLAPPPAPPEKNISSEVKLQRPSNNTASCTTSAILSTQARRRLAAVRAVYHLPGRGPISTTAAAPPSAPPRWDLRRCGGGVWHHELLQHQHQLHKADTSRRLRAGCLGPL